MPVIDELGALGALDAQDRDTIEFGRRVVRFIASRRDDLEWDLFGRPVPLLELLRAHRRGDPMPSGYSRDPRWEKHARGALVEEISERERERVVVLGIPEQLVVPEPAPALIVVDEVGPATPLPPIADDAAHAAALARCEQLMQLDPQAGSLESAELSQLAARVNAYEKVRWPISSPSAEERAAFRREQEQAPSGAQGAQEMRSRAAALGPS